MNKNAVIFLGPTLEKEVAKSLFDAVYLPPVKQGDLFDQALKKPFIIGIIDGCFDSVPSVWHKEVLWALTQGIHVFGASSMGALRAAELHAFGMVGSGKIFEDFLNGILIDDDEVAVIHAPDELNNIPFSVAMVDIRPTLKRAYKSGIINEVETEELLKISKNMFYPDRKYQLILDKSNIGEVKKQTLLKWLEANQFSQKREDAIELLNTLYDFCENNNHKKQINFQFENTEVWQGLYKSKS